MNDLAVSVKPSNQRPEIESVICEVVERSYHHCGDDILQFAADWKQLVTSCQAHLRVSL